MATASICDLRRLKRCWPLVKSRTSAPPTRCYGAIGGPERSKQPANCGGRDLERCAKAMLWRQMEEWGVAPDVPRAMCFRPIVEATSSEYLVALLCQGFRVKTARKLLKRWASSVSF